MAESIGTTKAVKTGGLLGVGLNAFGTISTFKDARSKGSGVGGAIGRAAIDFAYYEMLGPLSGLVIAKDLLAIPAGMAHEYGKTNTKISNRARTSNFGGKGGFNQNEAAYTMRSRGVQAMQQSKLTGYSTLGHEARGYFR